MKFRSYEVGLVYDITKAYNSIKTGLVEKHIRHLWMRMDPKSEDWKLYGFTCVQFRDRPAAVLMSIAVEKASETYKEVAEALNLKEEDVKEDAKKLLQDTYVDDGTTGGRAKDVSRMLGEKLQDGSFSGTISRMMQSVGLRLKTIVSSSNPDPDSVKKLSSKVLGCLYDVKSDFLGIKFTFNPSKKKKGLKTHPDQTLSDINKFHESSHSRRALWSCQRNL